MVVALGVKVKVPDVVPKRTKSEVLTSPATKASLAIPIPPAETILPTVADVL